jgi:RNA polymerase sigma-70 factor (ECF subfamily)
MTRPPKRAAGRASGRSQPARPGAVDETPPEPVSAVDQTPPKPVSVVAQTPPQSVSVDGTPPESVSASDQTPPEPMSDTGGFADIAARHWEHLERVALRLTGSAAAADDLVQETLERALNHFDRFRQGSNARTWLSTILTHLFLDQCKHAKVVARAACELTIEDTADDDLLIEQITDEELWAAVRALDPELREVVELCYLRGMKYREIAARLGVPVGTIGTRLLRARELLRQRLTARSDGKP